MKNIIFLFIAAFSTQSFAANCRDILTLNQFYGSSYSCRLKASTAPASETTTTIKFFPGATNTQFKLKYGSDTLTCYCQAGGTYNSPLFYQSKLFNCMKKVGILQVGITGKAKGDIIKNLQILYTDGLTGVGSCNRIPVGPPN